MNAQLKTLNAQAAVNSAEAWTDLYAEDAPVEAAWNEIPEGDWSWDNDMPVIR